jgi:Sulfotransferase domain
VHHSWNFGKKSARVSAKREAYRNPTETRESMFAGNSLRRMAAEWGARVGRTIEDGPALLGSNYAEVRYEDLLQRPDEEMAWLLRFLGADASQETVRRCVGAASFERLSKGRKRGEEDEFSFFRKGVAGDWKNAFTAEDRKVFKEEAGDLLMELDYEQDDNW